MELEKMFFHINPGRYHFLKFILEAYDGLCLLSTVPSTKGKVCLRYPREQSDTLHSLLKALSPSVTQHASDTPPGKQTKQTTMQVKSFYIKTFGCQMNERDSEIMAQVLGENGYVETSNIDSAELIILNTCSIRAKAEQKVMSMLGALRKQKKNNPQLKICVAGCVAQQEGERIIQRMPHVNLVIGTQSIYQLAELIAESSSNPVVTTLDDTYNIPSFIPDLSDKSVRGKTNEFKKFLTIMQGCNNYCTYCVVPFTRGREISRKASHILKEAQVLVDAGIREITLLGQNVNSYGKTNKVSESNAEYAFSDLLREVAAIPGLSRLRFTSSNPKDLSHELMRCFAEVDILCPHFHLPVQSGSNRVLSLMNRKYDRELYLERVAALRSYCPEITITTDMIVGFPGETDEDFEETMSLLNEVRYHGSYSFKYSDRPGTRSAEFTDKIDESVKAARLLRFQTRQDEICLEHNKEFVGKELTVMVERTDGTSIVARSGSNHLVHVPKGKMHCKPGDLIEVCIVHAGHHSLNGEFS
jgi:tRNA-2-methylthio-N6-dimethylallyladenosine synthase